MLSLGINTTAFQRKDTWGAFPAGCFQKLNGEVFINNHTGWGAKEAMPICERDYADSFGVANAFEARAADGQYKPVVVKSREADGSYTVLLAGGVQWSGVWQYNLRR